MSLMRALVLSAEERTAYVAQIPRPSPFGSGLLIRVRAVALNPVDSLYVFNPLGSTGRVVGSDFAGLVEDISEDESFRSSSSKLAIGSRVAGFVQGASSINNRPGAFAEYVVVPRDLVWTIPDSMSFGEAASISLCGLTAAQALYGEQRLGLTAPWKRENAEEDVDKTVFIYGASTSVGLYAAQLVHQCRGNVELIGCASPKHFEILRSPPYCYNSLIDYRTDWHNELSSMRHGVGVDLAYDCISEGSTVEKISRTIKPDGKLAVVRSAEGGAWTIEEPLVVVPSYGAVWEGLGEEVQYQGMHLPVNSEARQFAVEFYKWLSDNGDNALKPNKIRVMPGGLEKIASDGFRLLGSGSMTDRSVDHELPWMQPISAEKLVYLI